MFIHVCSSGEDDKLISMPAFLYRAEAKSLSY